MSNMAPIAPFASTAWRPAEYIHLTDENIRRGLKENGYVILENFFDADRVNALKKIYAQTHKIEQQDGGLFVSIYSANTEYRKKIHADIRQVIEPLLLQFLTNFKVSCYNFIVKAPGPKSALFIHQDMALTDENLFSPISIWSPLENLNIENGPMCVLPKSHYLIPPYRNLYNKLPFSDIYPLVYKYMKPLLLKAGDLLIFDSRVFHNSLLNTTARNRVAIAASFFPDTAKVEMPYKDPADTGKEFEMIEMADDVFLEFEDFVSEKVGRPPGKTARKVELTPLVVTEEQFMQFVKEVGLPENDLPEMLSKDGMNTIVQHYTPGKGFLQSVAGYFRKLTSKVHEG
ncbi:MAG: phytanoyl-CoA dioxygenase family protein [Chitinophagales bacterium]